VRGPQITRDRYVRACAHTSHNGVNNYYHRAYDPNFPPPRATDYCNRVRTESLFLDFLFWLLLLLLLFCFFPSSRPVRPYVTVPSSWPIRRCTIRNYRRAYVFYTDNNNKRSSARRALARAYTCTCFRRRAAAYLLRCHGTILEETRTSYYTLGVVSGRADGLKLTCPQKIDDFHVDRIVNYCNCTVLLYGIQNNIISI